ncbi:hypothetical protein KIE16_04925 [Pseudomonas syringae]|uniref:hypothetical protein n=1 Tax=Pseudomonas syringae TaxID=317 RepID=UPI001BD0F00F|nr:hypothetical protein [Pseudomonas syringae]MBS7422324.1 hypothetical protein [Pseudomonas syringae]
MGGYLDKSWWRVRLLMRSCSPEGLNCKASQGGTCHLQFRHFGISNHRVDRIDLCARNSLFGIHSPVEVWHYLQSTQIINAKLMAGIQMLGTAKQHFQEDISRASALLDHARTCNESVLRDDVMRASWMMAVGACDAYFSDAYADLIARTLNAKDLQPAVELPDRLNKLKVPVIAVIRKTSGWRWRMAARELIEDENVLSLDKIRQLFNQFCRKGYKPISKETIASWLLHKEAKSRLFGITKTSYRGLNPAQQDKKKGEMVEHFSEFFKSIFQRRHDCIHNCDRPKMALLSISDRVLEKRIEDITFLVDRCHDTLLVEFPEYLKEMGFSGAVRARACARKPN